MKDGVAGEVVADELWQYKHNNKVHECRMVFQVRWWLLSCAKYAQWQGTGMQDGVSGEVVAAGLWQNTHMTIFKSRNKKETHAKKFLGGGLGLDYVISCLGRRFRPWLRMITDGEGGSKLPIFWLRNIVNRHCAQWHNINGNYVTKQKRKNISRCIKVY